MNVKKVVQDKEERSISETNEKGTVYCKDRLREKSNNDKNRTKAQETKQEETLEQIWKRCRGNSNRIHKEKKKDTVDKKMSFKPEKLLKRDKGRTQEELQAVRL